MYAIFDIGGSHARIGVSLGGRKLDVTDIVPTPREGTRGITALAFRVRRLMVRAGRGVERFRACAVGIAGVLNRGRTMLLDAPHLRGWEKIDLGREFSRAIGTRTVIENDAALAALAEACEGAGRGFRIVAYLTVSTGIGGARIVDETIDKAVFGFEPGRQTLDERGRTLEALVSGSAIARRFGAPPKSMRTSAFWEKLARPLARGIVNTCAFWSPDVIVLGGPMITGRPAIPIMRIRSLTRKFIAVPELVPEIKKAAFGDGRGLIGGLHLLNARIREQKK